MQAATSGEVIRLHSQRKNNFYAGNREVGAGVPEPGLKVKGLVETCHRAAHPRRGPSAGAPAALSRAPCAGPAARRP